jgi:hypothetical protein
MDGLILTLDGLILTMDGLILTLDGLILNLDGLILTWDGLTLTLDGLILTLDGLILNRDEFVLNRKEFVMTRVKDWIPKRDDDFYNKQKSYFELIVANKVAWGIPDAAIAPLLALQAEYVPLYDTIQDKKNRTGAEVAAYRDCRKRYATAWRAFHQERVLHNSLIPVADKVILVGKARDTEPTPRGKITTDPIIGLKPTSGGDIEVVCRVDKDQTRASMHPLADAVECRYTLLPVGEVPPDDPEALGKTQTSKKARFIIHGGAKNVGNRLHGFFRWVNLTNPQNNGPWSDVQTVVVA